MRQNEGVIMPPRTETATLVAALRILSEEIVSQDGVANAAIQEGAQRIEELQGRVKELEEALRDIMREAHHPDYDGCYDIAHAALSGAKP